jgi:hypothetical protein
MTADEAAEPTLAEVIEMMGAFALVWNREMSKVATAMAESMGEFVKSSSGQCLLALAEARKESDGVR